MSADIFDQTYADTITSVIQATIEDNPEALEKLLKEKKSFRITDNQGWTPFHYACSYGHVKCLDVIFKSGKHKCLFFSSLCVWKLWDFLVISQILREINFGEFRSCKTALLWALNIVVLVKFSL